MILTAYGKSAGDFLCRYRSICLVRIGLFLFAHADLLPTEYAGTSGQNAYPAIFYYQTAAGYDAFCMHEKSIIAQSKRITFRGRMI